jgi:hypothetical protein
MGTIANKKLIWGGLLLIFSSVVFVDSMTKFLQADPNTNGINGPQSLKENKTNFPPIVSILASTFGCALSFFGMILGLYQLAFNFSSPGVTLVVFLVQTIFAIFVFLVEVFAKPLFLKDKKLGLPLAPQNSFDSVMEGNAAFCFGRLGPLFGWYATALGMVLYSCWNLRNAQMGVIDRPAGHIGGLRFMSLMTFLFGFCTLVFGCMAEHEEWWSKLGSRKYVYPPNFVEYPAITVITGLLVWFYSMLGMIGTKATCQILIMAAPLVWFWMVVFHTLLQLSQYPETFAFAGPLLGMKSFANIFGPAVLAARFLELDPATDEPKDIAQPVSPPPHIPFPAPALEVNPGFAPLPPSMGYYMPQAMSPQVFMGGYPQQGW